MIYGYAYAGTAEQNLEKQVQQLRKYIKDDRYIIVDKKSEKDYARCGYNSLVGTDKTVPILHCGDTIIITSLNCLGKNYSGIHKQWDYLVNILHVQIKILDIPMLDTSAVSNNSDRHFINDLVLQILSYIAEKERENTRIRQKQGIDAMQIIDGKRVSIKTGRPTGRPPIDYPSNWTEVYSRWCSKEITAATAMNLMHLKKNTFYSLARKQRLQDEQKEIKIKRKPIRHKAI